MTDSRQARWVVGGLEGGISAVRVPEAPGLVYRDQSGRWSLSRAGIGAEGPGQPKLGGPLQGKWLWDTRRHGQWASVAVSLPL